MHIPVHAHLTAQTEDPIAPHVGGVTNETSSALQGGNDSGKRRQRAYPGLNDDKPAATQGGEDDGVPYAEQDRPFLDALLGGPAGKARILAITSGHDHGNDVSVEEVKGAGHGIGTGPALTPSIRRFLPRHS